MVFKYLGRIPYDKNTKLGIHYKHVKHVKPLAQPPNSGSIHQPSESTCIYNYSPLLAIEIIGFFLTKPNNDIDTY